MRKLVKERDKEKNSEAQLRKGLNKKDRNIAKKNETNRKNERLSQIGNEDDKTRKNEKKRERTRSNGTMREWTRKTRKIDTTRER